MLNNLNGGSVAQGGEIMLGYLNTPVFASHLFQLVLTLYVEEAYKVVQCLLAWWSCGQVGEASRRFFDPEFYRIVLVDQRGCGKSQPFLLARSKYVLDSVAI